MPSARPRLLYVTDLGYQAKGRRYCDEDIDLTSRLREDFDLALCHPREAVALMDGFDLVVVRNSGPVMNHPRAWEQFRAAAAERGTRVYNQLTGKADMAGKQYLVDLSAAGAAVIPTVDRSEDLHLLPDSEEYVVKPKAGADSIGMRFTTRDRLEGRDLGPVLIQPRVPFVYEVSFYFVDDAFQYALHAPDPQRRWDLRAYRPSAADLAFARRFVDWNAIDHGIQRVDACRTPGGDLLLVELEDLNPFLSLDVLSEAGRRDFAARFGAALDRALA